MTDTARTGSAGGYDTCASVAEKEVWVLEQPTQTKRAHTILASAAGSCSFRAWPYRLMAAIMVLLRSLRCYPKLPEGGRGQRQLTFAVDGVSLKQVVGALPRHGLCHLPSRLVTERFTNTRVTLP